MATAESIKRYLASPAIHNGPVLPTSELYDGKMFYLETTDYTRGMYVYSNMDWRRTDRTDLELANFIAGNTPGGLATETFVNNEISNLQSYIDTRDGANYTILHNEHEADIIRTNLTLTVGPVGFDFTHPQDAWDSIKNKTVLGEVKITIEIHPGTYAARANVDVNGTTKYAVLYVGKCTTTLNVTGTNLNTCIFNCANGTNNSYGVLAANCKYIKVSNISFTGTFTPPSVNAQVYAFLQNGISFNDNTIGNIDNVKFNNLYIGFYVNNYSYGSTATSIILDNVWVDVYTSVYSYTFFAGAFTSTMSSLVNRNYSIVIPGGGNTMSIGIESNATCWSQNSATMNISGKGVGVYSIHRSEFYVSGAITINNCQVGVEAFNGSGIFMAGNLAISNCDTGVGMLLNSIFTHAGSILTLTNCVNGIYAAQDSHIELLSGSYSITGSTTPYSPAFNVIGNANSLITV